jgi:hypothetical protein
MGPTLPDSRRPCRHPEEAPGGWLALREIADHGTHQEIYIDDPDGNDLELRWDRPMEQWPRDAEGALRLPSANSTWTIC